MEGSESKKYDINIATKIATSAILFGAVALAERFSGQSKEEKFSRQDLSDRVLFIQKISGQWFIEDLHYNPVYNVLRAETFDGDVDQSEIKNIAADGDCFNLNVAGKTRHAKYLVCIKC